MFLCPYEYWGVNDPFVLYDWMGGYWRGPILVILDRKGVCFGGLGGGWLERYNGVLCHPLGIMVIGVYLEGSLFGGRCYLVV